MNFGSRNIHILLEVSLVWVLASAFFVWRLSDPAWGGVDYLSRFLLFTLPVWGFWAWASAQGVRLPRAEARVATSSENDWVRVTEEQARRHPLYGVDGWAKVLVVVLILSVVAIGFSVLRYVVGLVELPMGAQGLVVAVGALNIVLAAANVFALFQLVNRRSSFQYVFTAMIALVVVNNALTVMLAQSLPPYGMMAGMWRLPFGVATSIAWLVYVWRSRRINVTCRNRVRRRELSLVKGG